MDMYALLETQEHERLEFKKATRSIPRSLWETYASFANTYGGIIILGVEESKNHALRCTGVEDAKALVQDIHSTLNNVNKVSKNILNSDAIHTQIFEGKEIIIIEIPRANREDKPIFINNDLFGGTYRRSDEGDYHCTKEEVQLMVRDASSHPLDLHLLDEMDLSVLCSDTITRYRRKLELLKPTLSWNNLSDELFLYRLHAVGKSAEDGRYHPTVAGLLMFGYQNEIVKECPHYFLDYQEQMDPGTRWTDRIVSNAATWSGNIFDFYTLVIPRLELGLKTPFSLSGMTRVDDTALHHVMRESLANTLIHANYYERRGAVITRYPKGFTFSNPGILRVPKEDAIQGCLSDPRNATLFTMFTLLNIGERAGSGLSNIFSVWKAQGWKEPILEEYFQPERTTLQLIMEEPVRIPDVVEERGRYPEDTGDKAQQQRQKILTFLETVDFITNKQVCILLEINRSRAYDLLSQMVCESLLIAEGDKKGRRYRLSRIDSC